MQVATGGPPGGAHPCDDLAHLDGVPRPDSDGLEVVVRTDQPIAVVNFHAVSTTPGVPPRGPDHAGVGGIDSGAAACGEVLAKVEVSVCPADGADSVPKRGARRELFQRCHQRALGRAFELGGRHIERRSPTLRDRPDHGSAERDERPVVCQDCRGQARAAHMSGAGDRRCRARLNWRRARYPDNKKSCCSDRTRGQGAHSDQAEACRLFVPAGSPMSSHYLTPRLPARPQSRRVYPPM